MPVGLPRVSVQTDDDTDPFWGDLYNQLYQIRLLFLGDLLETELSNQVSSAMIYLNRDDSEQTQFMFINSPGGSVLCGLCVHDTIVYVDANVTTTCVGVAASMGSLVLTGGNDGTRYALPHARMMIHQPEGTVGGQGTYVRYERDEVGRLRHSMIDIYVTRTGQNRVQIEYDLIRDAFMTAESSCFYGLIDAISEKLVIDISPLLRFSLPFSNNGETTAETLEHNFAG
jgi:ATP-dependent Clp protease protease subunit